MKIITRKLHQNKDNRKKFQFTLLRPKFLGGGRFVSFLSWDLCPDTSLYRHFFMAGSTVNYKDLEFVLLFQRV